MTLSKLVTIVATLLGLLLGACDARAQTPNMTPNPPAIVAVIVGSPGPGPAALRYADDDAVRNAELIRLLDGSVHLVLSPDAETQNQDWVPSGQPQAKLAELRLRIDDALKEVKELKAAGRRVHFFFWYSGHGRLNPETGLYELTLMDGGFTSADLQKMLADSKAHINHVFLDACYSGVMATSRDMKAEDVAAAAAGAGQPGKAIGLAVPIKQWTNAKNTGWVLADTKNNVWETEALKGGVISHVLRSALYGAADVSQDEKVTYSELKGFLNAANHYVKNFAPESVIEAPQEGLREPVVTWVGRDHHRLIISAGTDGHFWVVDENIDARLVEFHTDGSYEAKIILANRRQYGLITKQASYLLPNQTTTRLADILKGPPSRQKAAKRSDPKAAMAEEALKQGLFREPFGQGYYSGSCKPSCEPLPKTLITPWSSRKPMDTLPSNDRSRGIRPMAWVTAGGAVAAVIAGALFKLESDASYEKFRAAREPDERQRLWSQTRNYDAATSVSFAVAAASGLAFVTVAVTDW